MNTGISIRDERMQKMLFYTAKFASAQYSVNIDSAKLKSLAEGESMRMEINGDLALFGTTKPLKATVDVVKVNDDQVLVTTAKPAVVKAADYGLDKGVDALKDIAKLPAISYAVPVNFSLMFADK